MKFSVFASLTLSAAALTLPVQSAAPAATPAEKVEPADAGKSTDVEKEKGDQSRSAPATETEKPESAGKADGNSGNSEKADDPKAQAGEMEKARETANSKILKSLHFKTGKQTVADGAVTINLPEGFQFLNGADARKVLVDLWGNPPGAGNDALGLILPAGMELLGDDSWAVVVRFDDSGYVSDEDAHEMDYDEILKGMQQAAEANNEKRRKNGYPAMTLKGWALPPHYDAQSKVLHWAKDFAVEGSEEDALNYDVRVLGRRGVVSLNCLASMSQVKEVEKHTPELVSMVSFNTGHAYADYDASTDKKAAYGIAGLIAGGAIAAKTGLLKTIWIAILAGKKFIVLGVLGIVGLVKKIFGRRSES